MFTWPRPGHPDRQLHAQHARRDLGDLLRRLLLLLARRARTPAAGAVGCVSVTTARVPDPSPLAYPIGRDQTTDSAER